MIPEISAAISNGKLAIDIVKGMVSLKNQVDVQMKAAELLSVILDLQGKLQEAQAASSAIQAQLGDMAAKQRQLDDWSAEKKNYRLQQLSAGGLVYRYHAPPEGNAPPHDLCAQCYQQHVKSILQPGTEGWFKVLKCHQCGLVARDERIESAGVTVEQPARHSMWDDYTRGF